jgi:hypothetical protein
LIDWSTIFERLMIGGPQESLPGLIADSSLQGQDVNREPCRISRPRTVGCYRSLCLMYLGTNVYMPQSERVRRSLTVVETLLDLQRSHGSAFVLRLVQRKLAVGQSGDGVRTRSRPSGRHGDAPGIAGQRQIFTMKSIHRQMPI